MIGRCSLATAIGCLLLAELTINAPPLTMKSVMDVETVSRPIMAAMVQRGEKQMRQNATDYHDVVMASNPDVVAHIKMYTKWENNLTKLGMPYIQEVGPSVDEPIQTSRSADGLIMERSHYIYHRATWDSAPIVIPGTKLIFFTVPKTACTVFKQLCKRMSGQHSDYTKPGQSHNPEINGLQYLDYYPIHEAHHMMTSPEWTRAIFVREPKERILSAYLQKALVDNGAHVSGSCCAGGPVCTKIATESFRGFLQIAHHCNDVHWSPISRRMEGRYWPYIDFIGRMEHVQQDMMTLLKQLGVWEEYGASGWGKHLNESIFTSTGTVKHATGAREKLRQYYTEETEQMVENMYARDYNTPLFGFNLGESRLFTSEDDH